MSTRRLTVRPGLSESRPRRSAAAHRGFRGFGPAAVLVVVLIAAWEAIGRLARVPAYLLPTPGEIVHTLVAEWPTLGPAAVVTVEEMLLGYIVAVTAALAIAAVLHASATVKRAVYPLLIGSQTIPVVVLAPILAIALGYEIGPKLVVIALICFFPVVVNTVDGLSAVDGELIRLMRTLDASRFAIFWRVELPGAIPSIFSGARVAATFAAIGAVFGEWSGATNGLGYVMLQATPQLRTALVFAAIVVLTVASVCLFLLVSFVERVLAPWARAGR